jgi:predicted DNA-binding transcriptional regulator YafY
MRRADRLFQIIQLLRRRHVLTAAAIAGELEVSERTVYRDIADLVRSGVPIAGEAGVGYTLRRGFDLPPLMFTEEEIEALVLGTRVVSSWADEGLAKAAESALARIEAALPDRLKVKVTGSRLFAPGVHVSHAIAGTLAELRKAIDARQKVYLDYTDADGAVTERVVRPLGLFFWGNKWSLTAWCELRNDFRDFRLDRMQAMAPRAETFGPEPGKELDDFFRKMESEEHVER